MIVKLQGSHSSSMHPVRKIRSACAAIAAALVVPLAGCGWFSASEQRDNAQFITALAEVGDVRDVVPATGSLIGQGQVEIRATQEGVIADVYVAEGERVRAGQLLARLDAPSVAPARDEASAGSVASQAAVQQARLALAKAEADRDRRKVLVERGFVSGVALDAANSDVAQARAALARSQAEAGVAQARVRRSQAEATTTEIRAPIAGTVVLSLARPGLRVGPADERALFQTIASRDELTLEILIPEPDMSRVSRDSRVSFTVDAYPSIRNEARLLSIGSAPIREGRFVSYRALASVSNTGSLLLPGMSASVELTRADSRRVLRIPARALFFRPKDYLPPMSKAELHRRLSATGGDMSLVRAGADGAEFGRLLREGKRLIFSLKDGDLVRHEVRVGAETDEFVEVTEGLKGGELVVVGHRPSPASET